MTLARRDLTHLAKSTCITYTNGLSALRAGGCTCDKCRLSNLAKCAKSWRGANLFDSKLLILDAFLGFGDAPRMLKNCFAHVVAMKNQTTTCKLYHPSKHKLCPWHFWVRSSTYKWTMQVVRSFAKLLTWAPTKYYGSSFAAYPIHCFVSLKPAHSSNKTDQPWWYVGRIAPAKKLGYLLCVARQLAYIPSIFLSWLYSALVNRTSLSNIVISDGGFRNKWCS